MCERCDRRVALLAQREAERRRRLVDPPPRCYFCHRDADPTISVDRPICARCANGNLVNCACCNAQRIRSNCYQINDTRVCVPCYRESYMECTACYGILRREDASPLFRGRYCVPCSERYIECPSCTDNPNAISRDSNQGCCHDCYYTIGSSEHIRDYSYTPELNFRGEGKLFFGMEVEISTRHTERKAAAQLVHDAANGIVYLKQDGSFDGGFEIVTHPMTLEWALSNFPWDMFNDLEDAGGRATDQTGIHVHVSREGFTAPSHIYKWLQFFYRNEDDISRIARRRNSSWARWNSEIRENMKDYAKGEKDAERYSAVNVQNEKTFEVRVFSSSTKPEEIQAALQLVAASVEYARYLTVSDIRSGGYGWEKFITWIQANNTDSRYESLLWQDSTVRG